jgi:hypothetical protein
LDDMNSVVAAYKLKRQLRRKNTRKVIAFDLPSLGYLQFFQSVLKLYAHRHPHDIILIIHGQDTEEGFKKQLPDLSTRFIHVREEVIRMMPFPEIDIFLTSEENNKGLDCVYSIALFHGQPSKGLTFTSEIVDSFDALFLYGPLYKDALNEFLSDWSLPFPPHLEAYEIGYPKSDDLLNGIYSNHEIKKELALDETKRTILYAPAFNEGASLREFGLEVIELLAQQTFCNIIVKLPIDCWKPTSNFYATGGVNWFDKICELESRFSNLWLYSEFQIDPLLAFSDVLITCISGVSFEFLALNRPVVFIDTPKYFSGYLKGRFPDKDTVSWANRTTAGGKEFGLVVKDIRDLPNAIETVLSHPNDYPKQQEHLKHYLLYNRGRATETAVNEIEELLAQGAKSSRPWLNRYLLRISRRLIPAPVRSAIKRCIKNPVSVFV